MKKDDEPKTIFITPSGVICGFLRGSRMLEEVSAE
jgi:hypothetical protein